MSRVPEAVWHAAKQCPAAGLWGCAREDAIPIADADGTVVGLIVLKLGGLGRRVASVYVLPEHRRKGLVLAAYQRIEGPLIACVRDDNVASVAMHERAGFRRWRRFRYGWWLRRK